MKKPSIKKLSFPKAPKALKIKTDVTAGGEGFIVPCVRPVTVQPCVRPVTIQPCVRHG